VFIATRVCALERRTRWDSASKVGRRRMFGS
jgi:hypothetical protein